MDETELKDIVKDLPSGEWIFIQGRYICQRRGHDYGEPVAEIDNPEIGKAIVKLYNILRPRFQFRQSRTGDSKTNTIE